MGNAAAFLGPTLTKDYRPTAVSYPLWTQGQRPLFTLWDLEAMRHDPQVQFGLRILRAPVQTATWKVTAQDPEVGAFVDGQLQRIWRRGLTKMLSCLEYGRMAAEVVYTREDGLIQFHELRDLYCSDAMPLERDGRLAGVQAQGVHTRGGKPAWLLPPRSFWLANEPPFGSLYGKSRLAGCWEPWMEKRGRHGAIDIRRLWYVKNAYLGGVIRHPPGVIEDGGGGSVSCQDYARELIEKLETGGLLVLPSSADPAMAGKYLWEYEPPKSNGEGGIKDVREYPKDLDREILIGMGVPPEVVEAATSGSGWSGRSVPFLVFLAGEDLLVDQCLEAADAQIVRGMARENFGAERCHYKVEPVSLAKMAQQQPSPGGQPQPEDAPPAEAPPPGAQMSTAATHGEDVRALLREALRRELERGAAA